MTRDSPTVQKIEKNRRVLAKRGTPVEVIQVGRRAALRCVLCCAWPCLAAHAVPCCAVAASHCMPRAQRRKHTQGSGPEVQAGTDMGRFGAQPPAADIPSAADSPACTAATHTQAQVEERAVYPTYFSDRFPSQITPGGLDGWCLVTWGFGLAGAAAHPHRACLLPPPPLPSARPVPRRVPFSPPARPAELSKEIAQGLFEIKMINKNGVVQEDPRCVPAAPLGAVWGSGKWEWLLPHGQPAWVRWDARMAGKVSPAVGAGGSGRWFRRRAAGASVLPPPSALPPALNPHSAATATTPTPLLPSSPFPSPQRGFLALDD